jgi:hypothetical protein
MPNAAHPEKTHAAHLPARDPDQPTLSDTALMSFAVGALLVTAVALLVLVG